LRSRQFPEDAGPMAHPVRPDSYIEINNFYTVTIYEKGAEVIRMLHTLIGAAKFRQGMDLYFARHDGQAVTCEDFVCAMEDASGCDLAQFRRWYSQAGTPHIKVVTHFDDVTATYSIDVEQYFTAGAENKQPMHLPLAVALLDGNGQGMPLHLQGDDRSAAADASHSERVLEVTLTQQTFCFEQVSSKPVLSLLRGFSAPVEVHYERSDAELAFLLAKDSDSFCRWEASQILATRQMESFKEEASKEEAKLPDYFVDAFGGLLQDETLDAALRTEALTLPSIEAVAERHDIFEVDRLAAARRWLQRNLAQALEAQFAKIANSPSVVGYSLRAKAIGDRALTNCALSYLVKTHNTEWLELAERRFAGASNMTDQLAALQALIVVGGDQADAALDAFYQQWKHERLAIDKWFSIQAMADRPGAVERVERLLEHSDFELANPNRARALLGAFSMGNPEHYHTIDGRGYRLLTRYVMLLDEFNPQVAARFAGPLIRWQRLDSQRALQMQNCLREIAGKTGLSRDVFEIVNRGLQD